MSMMTLFEAAGINPNTGRPSLERLAPGQHLTPPAGYPKDRNKYAVPEFYMYPIDTKARTKAAMDYFHKHDWRPEEHEQEAAKRIIRAAKEFGIPVSSSDYVYKAAHGE